MVLFDFDGTLADSRQIFLGLYNDLARERGYTTITAENLPELREMNISERCRRLGIPMYHIPFIAATILKKYKYKMGALSFYPEVREMLATLNDRGIAYAIVSSNSKENITAFFAKQGLPVPEVYTSSRIFGKDRLIKKVLRAKKLAAHKVLYVGDERRDLEACRRAGIRMAWVHWGYDSREALGGLAADFEPAAPADILSLLSH